MLRSLATKLSHDKCGWVERFYLENCNVVRSHEKRARGHPDLLDALRIDTHLTRGELGERTRVRRDRGQSLGSEAAACNHQCRDGQENLGATDIGNTHVHEHSCHKRS